MVNYQIMTKRDEKGRYHPDYGKLIENASSEEEKEYLEEVENSPFSGYAFNLVLVTRQKCGHYEIFQSPCNKYYPVEKVLKSAEKAAESQECTQCICRWPERKQ